MIHILPKSFQGFCAAIKKHVAENDGHVIPCNDPSKKLLGFVCVKTNEKFYISVSYFINFSRYLNNNGRDFFRNLSNGINLSKYFNDKTCKYSIVKYANSQAQ